MLFRPIGGLTPASPDEQDRESLCSLWTVIPFPDSFLKHVPENWRQEILKFSPRLAPMGTPATLAFIGAIFEVPEADWAFVRDVLQVDPDKRPTAARLLQHPWLDL